MTKKAKAREAQFMGVAGGYCAAEEQQLLTLSGDRRGRKGRRRGTFRAVNSELSSTAQGGM